MSILQTHNLQLDRLPESDDYTEPEKKDILEAERDDVNINNDIIESAKTRRYIGNTKLRHYLCLWATIFVSSWMYAVGVILFNNDECYHLSDDVINMLLGTTTVQIIGIVLIVMKDVFDGKSENLLNKTL